MWGCVPLGGTLLEGVDDLSVLAELADEAFLSTQTAAEHVRAGKLDHLGQEGGQFSIDDLGEEGGGTQTLWSVHEPVRNCNCSEFSRLHINQPETLRGLVRSVGEIGETEIPIEESSSWIRDKVIYSLDQVLYLERKQKPIPTRCVDYPQVLVSCFTSGLWATRATVSL